MPLDANWVLKFLKASSGQALLGVWHTPGAAVMQFSPGRGNSPQLCSLSVVQQLLMHVGAVPLALCPCHSTGLLEGL